MTTKMSRLREVAARNAAMLRALPAYLPRVSSLVDEIECPSCDTWVSPRLFSPGLRACRSCVDRMAAARPWPGPTGGRDV